ncbi:hypothetical protein SmJEL517_g05998 [Synchytrium microbalum]|uniref:Phosphatidylinositol 4-kinase n=1 Tax=Synchytrium microbalum TaxID=1806994 RepID=A0A507BXI1_9FUNG|nr:uncharacterized protein SmJEL517_g05998 [Synchytrium microbalum]TPX30436.1 hypothetical protein SmJEL517_g05998 [Synchytrium microbalum]
MFPLKLAPEWSKSIRVITTSASTSPPINNPRDSLVDSFPEFVNPLPPLTPYNSAQFLDLVEEVRLAIADGIQPLRIKQGSSGSYFCRNRQGDIVGVFKPKNEEPYGNLNPKWVKWLHKNLLPCCFGRSCLIPNLGYISEAAASYFDRRLALGVVPRTEVVALASPAFFYGPLDRRAYEKKGKSLPPKLGSFQIFLRGYKDATIFFREGYDQVLKTASQISLPISAITDANSNSVHSNGSTTNGSNNVKRPMSPIRGYDSFGSLSSSLLRPQPNNSAWTEKTQREFQYGFERLVAIDYLIRNTDRGLDNWMVKYNPDLEEANPHPQLPPPAGESNLSQLLHRNTSAPPELAANGTSTSSGGTAGNGVEHENSTSHNVNNPAINSPLSTASSAYVSATTPSSAMTPTSARTITSINIDTSPPLIPDLKISGRNRSTATQQTPPSNISTSSHSGIVASSSPATPHPLHAIQQPSIRVAGIDNGLAFPFKHPDRFRSYPFGWAALPCARVPFSAATRALLLPLLTSQEWWKDTFDGLELLFRIDPDFKENMWLRQKAVIRGQGYNLVEVLRQSELNNPDTGSPWALVRRPVVAVFEEIVLDTTATGDGLASAGSEHEHGHGLPRRRAFTEVRHRFESFTRSRPCFSWC